MHRRRKDIRTETRLCAVCGEGRGGVLYVSWQPAGRLSRRRIDERWRWRCLECGSRTPTSTGAQHRGTSTS